MAVLLLLLLLPYRDISDFKFPACMPTLAGTSKYISSLAPARVPFCLCCSSGTATSYCCECRLQYFPFLHTPHVAIHLVAEMMGHELAASMAAMVHQTLECGVYRVSPSEVLRELREAGPSLAKLCRTPQVQGHPHERSCSLLLRKHPCLELCLLASPRVQHGRSDLQQ